ncbi:MAG: 23S rRNA (adenine(2503)-C(2))-methyltransferase RlmN [Verrucomicrobia bacterium]|nr:23S rRNA (adenine(2503)-C(2))-methyltransferase RlmN [Verrucomicrobiota bacterium]
MNTPKPDIKSLKRDELAGWIKSNNYPQYRVDQVLEWLYKHKTGAWEKMSNLPKSLRDSLKEAFTLQTIKLVEQRKTSDNTIKFLWRFHDGALIESVLLRASPALYGDPGDRRTLCISTQVGCALACRFCASGARGFIRNLDVHEIIEQIAAIDRPENCVESPTISESDAPAQTNIAKERAGLNIVIMGMGEPLANYNALIKALSIINAPWGLGIGARKITISTAGIAPRIQDLAGEPSQFRLAVSLHAATDQIRSRLMPINDKYPLSELISACLHYAKKKGRMLTFEYILMDGVNDSVSQAERLASIARRTHAKVNLIPYNPVPGFPWKCPPADVQSKFLKTLEKHGIPATLRREKGGDIDAACGQLRLRTIRENR